MPEAAAQHRIQTALQLASDTRVLRLGRGVVHESGDVFQACFAGRPAVIVADANTFEAAGRRVHDVLTAAGVRVEEPHIFDDPDLHAYYEYVQALRRRLDGTDAIPIAVGSGTINDLTKLAAHECGRRYMSVATAASMDGYTAYGASVTHEGSKQTFFCPAPLAVIADLDVICRAPGDMNAAGYADLAAKVTAGADWIVADALGIEPVDPQAWTMVQEPLRAWLADPSAIRRGEFDSIAGLTEGLLMTGFAMQWSKSSRPASGAEHQFSHLWDMQHHRHNGHIPFHGCKVAIGTLASTLLYERLFEHDIASLEIDEVCSRWPGPDQVEQDVVSLHEAADLRTVALTESRAKHVDRAQLRDRLLSLRSAWPRLRGKLQAQLIPAAELRQLLDAAGSPSTPAQIGITTDRLKRSYRQAWQIRRRYTVLDVTAQAGLLTRCVEELFAPAGAWMRIIGQ